MTNISSSPQPKRIKSWVAALISMAAIYLPQTPLMLTSMDEVALEELPCLPVVLLVGVAMSFFDKAYVSVLYYIISSYLMVVMWAGGLFWLSFKKTRTFLIAIFASATLSSISGIIIIYLKEVNS